MQVRKKFRRIKRFVYLGAITGTVVTVRRQRARKAAGPAVGAPASWPPLESSKEPPVAASGSWADRAPTTSKIAPADEPSAAVPVAAEPTAAVGALVDDAETALAQAGGDASAVDEDGVAAAESGADESATGGQGWVAPTYGACPTSHPVKANANSGIFHLPGGRFYDRTQAERCYVDAASAEADGYRAAKEH